ncbi:MAG: DUF7524 family protein [Halobacteriota archaeon]
MRPTLRVHVNRDGPRSVEPEDHSFDVDGPFDLVLDNHGQPTHVHVHVDDALARVTDVGDANWYVGQDAAETVPVEVESIDAVDGLLEVSTGYGAERSGVEVHVAAGSGGVEVDEELGKIQPDTEPESTTTSTYAIAAAFVLVGLVVAIGITVLLDELAAVVFGLLTVTVAVAVSLYLLFAT